MVIPGRIHNGVVALGENVSLPEGLEVTVFVPAIPEPDAQTLSETERNRVLEVMDRIAALPVEGDEAPFSGADHDSVLYGSP
jgi:hypothetical protein